MNYHVNPDPRKMITLKELRKKKRLSGPDMAQRLGMDLDAYYKAEKGKPPLWMEKAINLFDVAFEEGYLPNQLLLAENPTDYRMDADK